MVTPSIDVRLPVGAEAAGIARRAVEALTAELPARTLEDLRLLVSELVTNSIRHAGVGADGAVELSIRLIGGGVRVEVTDEGAGFEPPVEPDPGTESGWGLYLVDQISDRWGVLRDRGTRVWFELDV